MKTHTQRGISTSVSLTRVKELTILGEITRMTPRLQRSQALSYPALSKSSGAAYCSVKQGVCRGALPAGHRRANPKSITFSIESSPSSANSTFCRVNKENPRSSSYFFFTFTHFSDRAQTTKSTCKHYYYYSTMLLTLIYALPMCMAFLCSVQHM